MNGVPRIVLLVDDHTMMLGFRASQLRLLLKDVDVITANSAEQALAIAKGVIPDVIVSDIQMERRDSGWTLCRDLLDDPVLAATHVILFTAGDLTEEQLAMASKLRVAAVFERSSMAMEPLVEKIRELLSDDGYAR